MKLTLPIALSSITILMAFVQLPADAEHIVRLSPAAFAGLPRHVVREMERLGCTIPQSYPLAKRSNVIRGEFTRPGQTDWAAVCSNKGVSSVLVFQAGAHEAVEVGPRTADKAYIALDADGTPVYQRTIRAVARKTIMYNFRELGGPKPPPIDHQGIEDAFLEKASVIHYFYRGKWLELQGAD